MNELIRKRAHLRAPLHEGILFECDQYVLSGMCSNISEGGLLIEHLSLVPEKKNFNVIVPLVYFPDFSKMNIGKLLSTTRETFERDVIGLNVSFVRSFEGLNQVDKTLQTSIGVSFNNLSNENRNLIQAYVQTYAKNIVYLLSLFEHNDRKTSSVALIRKTSELLGYNSDEKISVLRLKILHDYQSLESA